MKSTIQCVLLSSLLYIAALSTASFSSFIEGGGLADPQEVGLWPFKSRYGGELQEKGAVTSLEASPIAFSSYQYFKTLLPAPAALFFSSCSISVYFSLLRSLSLLPFFAYVCAHTCSLLWEDVRRTERILYFIVSVIFLLSTIWLLNPSECIEDNVLGEIT